jgi:hypothetical protein
MIRCMRLLYWIPKTTRRDRQYTGDNMIRCVRFLYWIPKATNTHSAFVMLIFFVHDTDHYIYT